MQDITSKKSNSINLKRGITIGAISLGAILIALSPSTNTSAEGTGSPAECESPNANLTGNDSILSFTAPDGNIIDGVCIKSGNNMFTPDKHSTLLGNGTYENGCYQISGVGTSAVTVERIGTPSDTCQGLSHVDVIYSIPSPTPAPTVSPTAEPSSSPTPEPTPSPTPTPSASATPSPTSTPSASPTSTTSSSTSDTSNSSSPTENTGAVLGASATAPTSTPLPGAVLGASAQLPETGPETTWVLMGALSLLSGSGLIKMGLKRK